MTQLSCRTRQEPNTISAARIRNSSGPKAVASPLRSLARGSSFSTFQRADTAKWQLVRDACGCRLLPGSKDDHFKIQTLWGTDSVRPFRCASEKFSDLRRSSRRTCKNDSDLHQKKERKKYDGSKKELLNSYRNCTKLGSKKIPTCT